MSAELTNLVTKPPVERSSRGLGGLIGAKPWSRTLLIGCYALAVFSFVRIVTDQPKLTSTLTFVAAVGLAAPILLAGLGGLFSERSGIVNIGLEGMMIMGTWFAGYAGWQFGPWYALIFGAIGGMLGGIIHAVATVTFGVDQIVSGIAINIIAPGVARFLSSEVFVGQGDGTITQSPSITGNVGSFSVPILSPFFEWLNEREWFFISDLAGLLAGFTTDMAWSTFIAWILLPISFYVLWRTSFGLRLRSAGEKPSAADSLGVSVYRMRYAGVLISGALAGLGGAWLVLEIGAYNQGQTAGRGYQGLAAMIFGNWRPGGLGAGAGLFAYSQSISLNTDRNTMVLALFLFAAIMIASVAVVLTVRRKIPQAVGLFVIAFATYWYYSVTDEVNNQIAFVTPYVVTLLVLALASQRLRPPAAEGRPWFKGQSE
jgi:simple sugar transport system permease protein